MFTLRVSKGSKNMFPEERDDTHTKKWWANRFVNMYVNLNIDSA